VTIADRARRAESAAVRSRVPSGCTPPASHARCCACSLSCAAPMCRTRRRRYVGTSASPHTVCRSRLSANSLSGYTCPRNFSVPRANFT